jgi:hypothetical protein
MLLKKCNYNFNLSDVAAKDSASYLNVHDSPAADNLHILYCQLRHCVGDTFCLFRVNSMVILN